MAISKIWTVSYSLGRVIDYAANPAKTTGSTPVQYTDEQYQALADVLTYAKDEEKTERQFYVEGINCDPSYAREQFINVKMQYGKMDGIQAYHGYLSFKEQNITPELAQKVGMEFARRVWGERFQIVVTTHLNTKHLHCHFVINSVSFKDGKMLHGDEKAWIKFRHVADEVCREYGLYYNPQPEYTKPTSYYYHKLEQDGMPTRYSMLRDALDEIINRSRGLSEFKRNLEQAGFRYQFNPNRKYWTVIPKGYDKPVRLYKLGEDYTNDAIMRRLEGNYQKMLIQPFQAAHIVFRPYNLPTREDKIRKVGGLYGLYLYYCYKLGYLPKYKRQNPVKIHYAFREDWLKLDRIAAQTRLLGREDISTLEQLFIYKAKVEAEIKTLIADRTLLRKELRKDNYDELSEARKQISAINERLKTLRKEVKLCDGIAERSEQIRENLSLALAEERSKSKEVRSDEQRW